MDNDDDDDGDESAWCVSALRAVRRRRMLAARCSLSHWPRVTRKRELRTVYLSLSLPLSLFSLEETVQLCHALDKPFSSRVCLFLWRSVRGFAVPRGGRPVEKAVNRRHGPRHSGLCLNLLRTNFAAIRGTPRRTLNASLELPWRHPSSPPPLLPFHPSTWSSSFVSATPRGLCCLLCLVPPYFSL